MTRYRIVRSLSQYRISARKPEYEIIAGYRAGDATASDFDEIIGWFDDLASAMSALSRKSTDIYRRGDALYIGEYGIEAVTIDEDGDETEWEYIAASSLPETISAAWSYQLVRGRYALVNEEEP